MGPKPKQRRDLKKKATAVCARLRREYGTPDLGNRKDPIEELILIALTRQTHWQNASRSWEALASLGGPEAILATSQRKLEMLLRPAGFAKQKAHWIRGSLRTIKSSLGSLSFDSIARWPNSRLQEFLRSLPGVSIKTAKCIMMFSMGRRVLPVDTHVRRVSTRIGLVMDGLSEKQVHEEMEAIVPPARRQAFHVNVLCHGREVCKALTPVCTGCAINDCCDARRPLERRRSAR